MKEIKITTRKSYNSDGVRSIEPIEATMIISEPTVPPAQKLTKADVWGDGMYNRDTKLNRGMRVAVYDEVCPIWKDIVPYKSASFVCPKKLEDEVIYWIEYVYGADCIVARKELDDLRVVLRAEYTCW